LAAKQEESTMRHRSIGVHCTNVLLSVAIATALQGCERGPNLAKVQANVLRAQVEGQKMVVDAQANLDKLNAQNTSDMVDAQIDTHGELANTSAPVGDDAGKVRLAAGDKVADAQYDVEKAKAEAGYNIASAQCGAQVGDIGKACKETAKASYDFAIATAKTKNDVIHRRSRATDS
jgi:hypothetical protein